MEYTVEARFNKGNGHQWTIIGLEDIDPLTDKIEPDTVLWLIGMEDACDTTKSVCNAIHGCLYDLYQTSGQLKDGDTFIVKPATINKYHSYDSKLGKLRIPAMTFVCEGVHVIKQQ